MGQVTTRSPLTGRLYTFNVAGNEPTEQERLAVAQYLIATEGQTQQPQTSELIEQEERESNAFIDVPREFTRSLAKSFADLPGGLASLATAISPLDKVGLGYVEDYVEAAGQGVTKAAKEGIDNLLGEPVDTPAGKLAGAVGYITSYFVPVGAAAKVASGLGKGAKAITAAGTGTGAAMGVAQGSQQQVERIARQIELGQEVDNKDLAVILGGVIGATELLPLQKAFRTFTRTLKGVPKDAKKDAIEAWLSKVNLKARAKGAAKTGLFEGAQEATAGWLQDLVEKNLYNPELDISLSSYQDDAIYGGGAGAAFNFFVDTIAGRKLKKSLNSRNQLEQDMEEEAQANRPLLNNAETSLGTAMTFDAEGNEVPKGGRPLIAAPKTEPVDGLEGQIPSPAQDAQPTEEQIAASANIKNLALDPSKEAQLQNRRAKEILLANQTEIDIKDLPEDEQGAVRQYRMRSGLQDIEAPITRDELEEAVSSAFGEERGIEAANREGAKRFPETFEPKLTEKKAAERKAEAAVQAKVAEVIEDAKAGLKNGDLLKANGNISLGKVKSKLKLKQNEAVAVVDKLKAIGYATPISPTELKPVLPEARLEPANFTKVRMLQDGVANDKDYLAGAEVSVTDTEALVLQQTGVAEPISEGPSPEQEDLRAFQVAMQELQFDRAEQQRRLDKMKEAGVQDQTQQIMLENQQRVVDDANARLQAALNKEQELLAKANLSNPQNSDGLPADQVLANEARQAAEESTASQPTDEYKRKINTVANLLRKYMFKELGIRDVDIVTENVLEPDKIKEGFVVEGYYDGSGEGRKIIALAMEIYDPKLTEAQLFQRLRGVLNHEVIHALRGLGVLTEQEFATLVKAASTRKFVKKIGGRLVERDYTFLDRAVAMNEGKSIEYQQEEAVAEMFRSYADGKIKVAGRPRTIFQKIGRFFKSIFNAHRDAGFTDAASIFDNIQSGKIGRRQRNLQAASAVPAGTKYSTAGIRAGFHTPDIDKQAAERIGMSFKDVTKRVEELTKSANELSDGEITYDEYDKRVNKFKPIIPYQTVPAPEGYKGMYDAMERQNVLVADPRQDFKQKVKKQDLVGVANQTIQDGQTVGIRLDIPAYRDSGTWIVSVHDGKQLRFRDGDSGLQIPTNLSAGSPLAYESTAVVTGPVSFGMAEAGALKIASGSSKGTIATFQGNWKNIPPDDAFALAQEMLADPNVIQVGMDPERHSYFYDRMTTQPVIGADLVVQVGPLVLAKNPQFAPKSDFKYSVARTQGLNTIREFIKNNPDGFTITSQGISVPIGTPDSGIVVAPIKDAELIVGRDIPINVLREYIENAKAMSGIFNREVFLGGWLNNDNGKYYLDNTLIVNDKAEALYFAQAAKQIAVYDLRVPPYGQEIVTDEGIRQLQEAGIYRSDTAEQYRRSVERASGLFRAARIENQRQREAEANLAARAYSVAITPKTDANGNVRLTHYSPLPNLEIVNPEEQGSNYRMRGEEKKRQASAWRQDYPARSYYGLNVGEEGGYSKEYAVGENIYVADVPLADLYNFEEDPKGFKSKADGMITDRVMELSWGDPKGFILTQAEKMIADAGYSGYYTNTPMGLVAAMFNPIKVKPDIADAKKFSVARLSPAEIALTSVNNVNTELGDPENNYYVQQAPYGSVLMQTAVLKMQQDRGNVVLNWDNPDNWETLARLMAAEAEVALSRDKTALGWYDRTLDTAKRITSILFPDIKPNTNAESAFIFATAVTSNGVPVIGNWQAAAEQYRNWKDTGRFIEKGYGDQGSSMIPAFQFYNAMKDLKYTDLEIKDFLNQKMTVRELRKNPLLKKLGYKDSGAESADTEVFVSYILGPKIGQGFYQNLVGNFSTLTMDRWWMRMFNRISGQPFVNPERPETFDKRVSEIIEFSNNPVSDAESTIINVAKAEIDADIITPENVDEFSYAVNRYFQRVYNRLSKSIKTAKESLVIAEQSGDPAAIQKAKNDLLNAERNRDRDPNKIFLPFKSRLFQRIGGHVGKLENARKGGEMQEDPRVPKQRQVMRAIANRAREIVQEDLGISMSNADFQALMWYPEKNLFYSYGVKKSQGDDNDYIDGAIALLEKEGYNVDTIAQALPESDARIVYDRRGAAESYERTGIELTETDRPEEGAVSDAGGRKRSVARVAPDRNYSMPTQVLSNRIDQQAKNHTYDNASGILAKVIRGATFGNVSKQKAQGLSERFLTKYQDSMLPLGKMLDEIRSNPDNDMIDAFDAYMQEELSQGVAGARIANNTQDFFEPIAEAMKNIDVSEVQLNSIGSKYIRDYLATEADPRQVIADAYLYARHAKERNRYILDKYKRGNGSGMSDAEADTILSWVNGQPVDLKASLDEVASIADQIVESTNAFRKEGDLIPDFAQVAADPESKWQPTNFSFYVPLRGTLTPEEESVDDFGNVPRRTPNLYGARGRNDARMKGRGTEYATDIVSHLMAQNMLTIQRAEKNKVGKAFYDMVASDQVDTADYAEIVDKVTDPNNTLTVKINGEDKHVEIFDDRIARAMNGAMTPQSQGGLVKFMAGLNRLLSNMNTSWNPEFVLSNFPRDLEAAGVNLGQYDEKGLTKDVIAGAFPAVKGIGDFLRTGNISSEWSGWYKEFVDNGGKNATNQMSDLQDSMNSIRSVLNDISNDGLSKKFGAMKNKFTQSGLIKFLDDWNTAVENGVRVSLYKQLVERGYSTKRAAQAARNITVNFAKGGEERALLNAWFLFYNASLQGTMALANAAVRSPKVRKLWLGLLVYGFMQDMILGSMSGDEDEDGKSDYDEIGDYELEHNFILPTFGLADEKYIAIPLSYGLNMAVNTGRSVSRLARGEYTPSQAVGSIAGTVLETLNPLGSGIDDYENILAPTVADPFLSVAINKDYKGAPIYKEGSPFGLAKPDSQMYWNNTGPIPKFIADQVNKLTGGSRVTPGYVDMSPDVLEFWFNYLTGATGAFVKRSIEAPVNIYDAIQGDFEGTLIETIPFVRKVVATPTEIQDMGTYIENKDKVLRARKELETAISYGEVEEANEIRKEYAKLLKIYGLIKGFENARNRLIRKKNEIKNSPRIPEERKSDLIQKINERIKEIVTRSNKVMYDVGIR